MEELRDYLGNHKGFRLTKEMIEAILKMADDYGNCEYEQGRDHGSQFGD